MYNNTDYVQAQKVTDDNGNTTSQTTVLNTQAEKKTGQTEESAPQVLVCSDADKPPQDSIDGQPQEETVTQNRQAGAYEGDGTKDVVPPTLTLGQSNAGAATEENNERREIEKPFLGAGRALDQLANLHFHFTSVPRCTPMVWGYNGTPMEILHLVEPRKKQQKIKAYDYWDTKYQTYRDE